jgi:uncharacterized protein YjgD (DUF1641 family)
MKTEVLNSLLEKDIDIQEDIDTLKKIAKAWKESFEVIQKLYLSEKSEITDKLKKKFPDGLSN